MIDSVFLSLVIITQDWALFMLLINWILETVNLNLWFIIVDLSSWFENLVKNCIRLSEFTFGHILFYFFLCLGSLLVEIDKACRSLLED